MRWLAISIAFFPGLLFGGAISTQTGSGSVSTTIGGAGVSVCGGYNEYRPITIATQTVTANVSNFPILLAGTYAYLSTVTASGGVVISTNGYDIRFSTLTDCSVWLNHEIDSYNGADGSVNFWVNIPTVSSLTTSTVNMFYGNSSITSVQGSTTAVWDSNFKSVQHLRNGTTLSTVDAVAGGPAGTIDNFSAGTGKVDGAAFSAGIAAADITYSSMTMVSPTSLTLSMVVKTTTTQSGQGTHGVAMCKHISGTSGEWYLTPGGATSRNDQMNFTTINTVPTRVNLVSNLSGTTTFYTDGNFHHYAGTYNGSSMISYFDGVQMSTVAQTGTISNPSAKYKLGLIDGGSLGAFQGTTDEVRVSNSARTADWIKMEYLTIFSTGTVFSIGNSVAASAGAGSMAIR